MIYFTADTHFGNQRTLEFSKRPFKNVDEMDQVIRDRWKNIVRPEDIVYHLGDFGDYENIRLLTGRTTLVMGNYEENDLHKNFDGDFHRYEAYLQLLGFTKVMPSKVWVLNNLLGTGEPVNMTHCPKDNVKGIFNLFGHVHKLCMIKKYGLNVGTDCHNFTPIDIDTVLFYKNAIENHYDDNVFE
jgi:calcineurin-like phosphoesterase family protein